MGNAESTDIEPHSSQLSETALPTYSSVNSADSDSDQHSSPQINPRHRVVTSSTVHHHRASRAHDKRPGADFVDVSAMDTLSKEQMERKFLEIVVSLELVSPAIETSLERA